MSEVTLIPLGVGEAFTSRYYTACLALGVLDTWLLIDCPHPARKMLREGSLAAGLSRRLDFDDIHAAAISHLHADHSCGLEDFGYYSFFAFKAPGKDLDASVCVGPAMGRIASASELRANQPMPQPGDDLWKNGDDKGKSALDSQQDPQNAGEGDQQQDQTQEASDQSAAPAGESPKQGNNSQQSQQDADKTANDNPEQQQQGASAQDNNNQTLGQTIMQALKSMMSSSPDRQTNGRDKQPPQQNGQGSPQAGDSHQASSNQGDKSKGAQGTSDAPQKATQSSNDGAGSQEGLKDKRIALETHPVNAVPDRVALEASSLKEQTRMRALPETGTAQLPTRDISPAEATAVINGAEQENIPARYRLYVQHYFEHAENGQQ